MKLRRATVADEELLFTWANDPATRAASFSPTPISRLEHATWFRTLMSDERRRLWIAEVNGVPVAQVRLDQASDHELISISVDAAARGQGLAARVVAAVCSEARGAVVARIRPTNEPSLRAFTSAGFTTVETSDEEVIMRRG